MLISILIANYNNSGFIKNAIESVYAQDYTEWEIVIVDDGSTDYFDSVMLPYLEDNRIRIFRNENNRGCTFTKARCIQEAKGVVLGFLDPDDALAPSAIAIMQKAHINNPSCSIIHSTHYVCDEFLNILQVADYPRALPSNTPFLLLNDGSVHHFATFKKACYDKTEGLSLVKIYDKAVDMELYYLLEEEGDILFIDKPLYYYRIHKGSISNWGNEGKATLAHYQVVEHACLRRIRKYKSGKWPEAEYWIKRYRTRYYKIRIFHSFRRKQWGKFALSAALFPFVGGMENIISYLQKLPSEGASLLRRSFLDNYKVIKHDSQRAIPKS